MSDPFAKIKAKWDAEDLEWKKKDDEWEEKMLNWRQKVNNFRSAWRQKCCQLRAEYSQYEDAEILEDLINDIITRESRRAKF